MDDVLSLVLILGLLLAGINCYLLDRRLRHFVQTQLSVNDLVYSWINNLTKRSTYSNDNSK